MTNVILHYNGTTETIPVEGSTEISLVGDNWTKTNDNTYTYNGYDYTDIIYTDGYGTKRTERTINDVYFNGEYDVSYTGNQYLQLTDPSCGVVSGYTPTFDFTGTIAEVDTGNVFGNFAENSLQVLLTNIPNYIQYVIMGILLVFILSLFRKFK